MCNTVHTRPPAYFSAQWVVLNLANGMDLVPGVVSTINTGAAVAASIAATSAAIGLSLNLLFDATCIPTIWCPLCVQSCYNG